MYRRKCGKPLFSLMVAIILIMTSLINPVSAISQDYNNFTPDEAIDSNSADTSYAAAQAEELPAVPSGIAAISSFDEMTVVWEEVYGATGYDIEADNIIIDNGLSTSYIHSGLEQNTEHTYRVRAKNNQTAGDWSSVFTFKTDILPNTPIAELPPIPSGIKTTSSFDKITLVWEEVYEAEGYDIEADNIIIDNGLSTSYIHSGLEQNTEHTYRVRAKNSAGDGKWSEIIQASTTSITIGTPQNVKAIPFIEAVSVVWEVIEGTTGYEIEIDRGKVETCATARYVHSGLSAETEHVYRVRAKNGEIAGEWSSELTVSTLAEGSNLALGKMYTKSSMPAGSYPDSKASESTDGILAGNYSDGKSYGYSVSKSAPRNVEIIVDLHLVNAVSEVKVHKWEGSGNYGADSITISLSSDGTSYTEVGTAGAPTGIWYDIKFDSFNAQYIKVAFSKSNVGNATDWLFIDEIEVYGGSINEVEPEPEPGTNLALGKNYTRTLAPSGSFPDSDSSESTDGILAGGYNDGKSYGYSVRTGKPLNVGVIVDLSRICTVSEVKVHKWEGSGNYGADSITISLSRDGISYTEAGTVSEPTGIWYDLNFDSFNAQYVKVAFSKSNIGNSTDWLFIDEIEVYNNSDPDPEPTPDTNLALDKIYTKSAAPSSSYPDTRSCESTDGILAGNYGDGKSYGYYVRAGKPLNVDVVVDLEKILTVSEVKVHKWEGSSNYGADNITVLLSSDNANYTEVGAENKPDGIWFDFEFDSMAAQYIKVIFNKSNVGNGTDWLFIDEIEAYSVADGSVDKPTAPGNISVASTSYTNRISWDPVSGANSYEIEINGTTTLVCNNTSYIHADLTPATEYQYRVRTNYTNKSSDWSSVIKAKTAPAVIRDIRTTATAKSILIEWDADVNAEGYDIEVDGTIVDNYNGTSYTHSGLAAEEEHVYRVRAKSGSALGDWSSEIRAKTLMLMEIPANIKYIARERQITLFWDAVISASGYDIEVDGVTIDNSSATSYLHDNLAANSTHTYRVRSKSLQSIGDWSPLITVQTTPKMLGRGTSRDPYIVINRAHLESISKNMKAYYRLGADIDLQNIEWIPLGTNNNKFKGSLDGAGYTINNLLIDKPSAGYIGLFGYVNGAALKNIKLENVDITGKDYVGALAGFASPSADVQGCTVTGTGSISGVSQVGGLIGKISGNALYCSSTLNVTGTSDNVGGLFGSASGVISNCYTTGSVSTQGKNAGGMVGEGQVIAVLKSFASGDVTGNQYIGGLVGGIKGGITRIENCYATGAVKALNTTSSYAGGLLGGMNGIATLSNSYSAGNINAKGFYIGGLTGTDKNGKLIIINCYFDSTVTGITAPASQARTTEQLRELSNYKGWDFNNVWDMGAESSYPVLKDLGN